MGSRGCGYLALPGDPNQGLQALGGRVTFSSGPEGNVRGIWHQPQGRRRSQRSEPAGSILFLRSRSDALVIDALHEPLVSAEVVVQLAQEVAVEQRLPV